MTRNRTRSLALGAGVLSVVAAFVAGACGGKTDEFEDPNGIGQGGDAAAGGSAATSGASSSGRGGTLSLGGTAGTGQGASSGMGGEGGGCGQTDLAAEPPPVSILLVVDKSSSMTGTPSGFSEDKWTALGSALGAALDAAEDSVAFGLDFYPFGDDRDPSAPVEMCDMPSRADILVPIGPGASTVPLITDALSDYQPAGGTPTAAALARA